MALLGRILVQGFKIGQEINCRTLVEINDGILIREERYPVGQSLTLNVSGVKADIVSEQTAIVGCVQKDLNCLPVENAQYQRYIAEKNRNLLKADRGTVIVSDLNSASGNLLAPGTSTALNKFTNFTVSLNPSPPPKPFAISPLIQKSFRNQPVPLAAKPKKPKPPGCPKTNSWTSSKTASKNTATGP